MTQAKHSTIGETAGAERLLAYGPGDEVTFGFEGNVRATVEGFRVVGGRVWLAVHTCVSFEVPVGRVVACERAEAKGVR